MSAQNSTPPTAPAPPARRPAVTLASSLTLFAGIMMLVIGVFQGMQGLAAILEDDFFVVGRAFAYELDLTTWGWVHLIGGIIVAVAGAFVLRGAFWAQIVGIVVAALSAIANFAYLPYYPFWSLLIIALNVLVIWALATHRGAVRL